MKVLQDKNVNVLNETAFREYVSLMLNGLQGIRRTSYKRPTDWLAMPAIGTTEEKVECLIPVYSDNAMNYATVTATGNYSVNWGDGTTENFSSGAVAQHQYSFAGVTNPATSKGYKQAIVTIAPQAGNSLTTLKLNGKHPSASINNLFQDILGNAANLTALEVSDLSKLEVFSFGYNALSDFSGIFYNCLALQDVPMLERFAGSNYSVVLDYVGLAHNHDNDYIKKNAGSISVPALATNGISSVSGSISLASSIIPIADKTLDLGSSTHRLANVYADEVHVGASSLYVNGKQVISDVSDTMTFSTEADKSMNIKTTGAGSISILSDNQVNALAAGGLEWRVPATNPSKNINFTNLSANGNISFSSANQILLNAADSVVVNNVTISGNLTVSGTTTVVNTEQLTIKDNMITLNSSQTGTPPTTLISGIDINRGDAGNYRFIFDELTDSFKVGQVGSLQPVATREDTPTENGVAFWDKTNSKMATSPNLAFDGANLTVSTKRVVTCTSATAFPTTPGFSDMCYRTDLDELYFYQGAVWIQI